jgi:hypothetical protein
MQLKTAVPLAAVVSAALVASVAGLGLGGAPASAAPPGYTRTTTTIAATDDTFVAKESPKWAIGSLSRLVAQNTTLHKQAYLKFVVPANLLGTDSTVESAVLALTALTPSSSRQPRTSAASTRPSQPSRLRRAP